MSSDPDRFRWPRSRAAHAESFPRPNRLFSSGLPSARAAVADLVQQAVDDGANTAETAKDVRRVQDASIGAIYDVVHRVNRQVAEEKKPAAKKRRAKS